MRASTRPFQFQLNNSFFLLVCVCESCFLRASSQKSRRLEIWVWNALFKCFSNSIEKFCADSVFALLHAASFISSWTENNIYPPQIIHFLCVCCCYFFHSLFGKCASKVETKSILYSIFGCHLTPISKWPFWKWNGKQAANGGSKSYARMRGDVRRPLWWQTRFVEFKIVRRLHSDETE